MFSFLHRSKHIIPLSICARSHTGDFSFYKMFHIIKRGISTTASLSGKKNFRKFLLYNKRGTRIFKQQRAANPDLYPDMPIDKRGVRDTGVTIDGNFVEIAEKIPELIVPNMEGCKFKPYVSYKAPDVVQSEFTSQDLFNSVYAQKIIDDWKSGKLNDDGSPMEPSAEEMQSAEEAWIKARKTGSDIF